MAIMKILLPYNVFVKNREVILIYFEACPNTC